MDHSNQSRETRELIRRALAPEGTPPPSISAPPVTKTPARKNLTSQKIIRKTPIFNSKIIEWDDQKGFGYLRHKKGKLFLHCKDFAERHKRPSVGDKIHYRVGKDQKGRRCAVEAIHVNDGGKISFLTLLSLALLMLLPALALTHLAITKSIASPLIALPLLLINIKTYFTYKSDKNKAKAKLWRTPEISLHFLEILGGWPAALLAQRQFRHKCSKFDFQFTYWTIVVFHISLAADYIFELGAIKAMLDAVMR